MKSLVVDDGFTNRRVLQSILSEFGQCDEATNGIDAIEMFKKTFASEIPHYDLICLDIMMPNINGLSTLKTLRQTEKNYEFMRIKRAKIVMTTSVNSLETVNKAVAERCNGYILKPVNKEKILDILKELKLLK